jgi:hypothetical protein
MFISPNCFPSSRILRFWIPLSGSSILSSFLSLKPQKTPNKFDPKEGRRSFAQQLTQTEKPQPKSPEDQQPRHRSLCLSLSPFGENQIRPMSDYIESAQRE